MVLRVVAGVIEREGRVLIARRRSHDHMGGKWEFPGGKLEAGETPEQGLERELHEEFGIQTQIGACLGAQIHHYPDRSIELMAYRVRCLSDEWCMQAHDELKWVRPEECALHEFAEADLFIIERLIDHERS